MLIRDRMLDYHDSVIDIPTLDQVVLEKILDLMEEHECPARGKLGGIINALIPDSMLDSKDPRAEINGQIN